MANGVEARTGWNPLRGLYAWVMRNAEGPHAWAVMAAIAFAESSFFPMPPDFVMIPMALKRRDRAFVFAGWCVLWSVAGGLLGYAIGSWLYDSVGEWLIRVYGMGGDIDTFRAAYQKYGALIVLQGLTPIPYKLVTITSGFAGYNFFWFVVLSVLTRGARFFVLAFLLHRYGATAREIIEKRLGLWTAIGAAALVGGFVIVYGIF